MKAAKKNIILILLLLSFSNLIFFDISFVSAKQQFPNEFSDITYLKYSFQQSFTHYSTGSKTAGGIIMIDLNEVTGYINFSIDHNLDVWTKSCTEAFEFDYDIDYRVDQNNRKIKYVDKYTGQFPGEDLENHYCYYYIDPAIDVGENRFLLHDDMMMFRGLPFHTSQFHCVDTEDSVAIQGDTYQAIHMQYNVYDSDPQLLYAGSICGLGYGIVINATIDAYYEVDSGMLLYSKAEYLEYYGYDHEIQQQHVIQRTVLDMDFQGEPTGSDGFTDTGTSSNPFWSDPDNVRGVSIIAGVFFGTFVAFMVIRKTRDKWKYDTIKQIPNVEAKLKQEINELEKQIMQERISLEKEGIL